MECDNKYKLVLFSDTKVLKDNIKNVLDSHFTCDPANVPDRCSQLLCYQIQHSISLFRHRRKV